MLLYLVCARPFVDKWLQISETICHTLEVVLFGSALALVYVHPFRKQVFVLQWLMIGCFLGVVATLMVTEIRRIFVLLKGLLSWWRVNKANKD
ncbi:MAG: hypothetical protein J3K34DRAFT_236030 [Monoraphidium minutum]|nr:MAG: hypothetical protein J3K34DRAFT_236030 [Monoraphidium minutum]